MTIGRAFVELGRFFDECEGDEFGSADVSLVHCDRESGEQALRATVDVRLTTGFVDDSDEGLAVQDLEVGPDGTLTASLETTERVVPTTDYGVDVEPSDLSIEADGTVWVTLTATVPTSGEGVPAGPESSADANSSNRTSEAPDSRTSATAMVTAAPSGVAQPADSAGQSSSSPATAATTKEERHTAGTAEASTSDGPDGSTASSERDVPPFKDPDLLQEVYETHDTFAEMADTIEMDVTAETVRRYMIDFDIHEPQSYASSEGSQDSTTTGKSTSDNNRDQSGEEETSVADGAGPASPSGQSDEAHPETQVVLSDGIGLPEDVTAETLIETVRESNTLYEVKQDVGVDRQDALTMLQDLNLLDFVMGRLTAETDRDITREQIIDRLREASAME